MIAGEQRRDGSARALADHDDRSKAEITHDGVQVGGRVGQRTVER
jgi:ATP-dependent protease HslVU (ClpYQ) peptidase subunit